MKENNSRREFLSQSGKMVTAAALFGTSVPLAHAAVAGTLNCEANNTMKIIDPHYYLDNVLLETGFDYENGVAVQTRTARQTVEIQDGKIVALRENKQHPDATLPHYDAGGKLMLPTTRDMHIHLDKTFYGGPWRSLNRPAGTTIQDMIKLEQKNAAGVTTVYAGAGGKTDRSIAVERHHHCPQPLQYRTGFRPKKSAKFAGGAGAASGGLRV